MSESILNNPNIDHKEKKSFMRIRSGAYCEGCGVYHIILIDKAEITKEQLDEGLAKWEQGEVIQKALPFLSAECREILISGTCDESFKALFGEEE